MPPWLPALSALLPAAFLLAGCAASSATVGAAKGPDPSGVASVPPAAAGYKLSETEMKLDCPKLTGIMRVRIANMRAAYAEPLGSQTSQIMQKSYTAIYGGSRRGSDNNADLQADRAKLEAYNARLAEKKCQPLDLAAELKTGEPTPKSK